MLKAIRFVTAGVVLGSRDHNDADRSFHRGERESGAGGQEADLDLLPRRSVSLPYEPRTITIQRG
jgi:hypothetical protein